ncbi:histidine kinase [Streptomyces sp. NPDC051320]|uniref:sensor histidine kinase n=1 Tax=Streptomyces sp. NPDC051320 TaxID=3154644 RepID=UPI0034416E0C
MFGETESSVRNALRPLAGRWHASDVMARDGLLALLLAALAFTPGLQKYGVQLGQLPPRSPDTLSVMTALAQSLPLTLRRRWPAVAVVVVAGAFSADQLLATTPTLATLGVLPALYSAGAHQHRFRRAVPAMLTTAYIGLSAGLHREGSEERLFDYVSFYVVLATCWWAGRSIRRRQAEEADRRRGEAEAAVAGERARIARELHDVVTHHVTAVVIQADAAQFLVHSDPERATVGLAAISETGRRALGELRHMLGVLDVRREDGPPAGASDPDGPPDLSRLGDLVEQTRTVGQPVGLTERGTRHPVSGRVELAAYRVVQEGLTNAVKYAPGHRTEVHVRYGDHEIDIEVTNEGPAGAAVASGSGRGLAGLRERVALHGGELVSGARPDGGFTIHARLPVRDDG